MIHPIRRLQITWMRFRMYWRRRSWRRQVRQGIRVLKNIDNRMILFGWSRNRRKNWWRAFCKEESNRENLYKNLEEKNIYGRRRKK